MSDWTKYWIGVAIFVVVGAWAGSCTIEPDHSTPTQENYRD